MTHGRECKYHWNTTVWTPVIHKKRSLLDRMGTGYRSGFEESRLCTGFGKLHVKSYPAASQN